MMAQMQFMARKMKAMKRKLASKGGRRKKSSEAMLAEMFRQAAEDEDDAEDDDAEDEGKKASRRSARMLSKMLREAADDDDADEDDSDDEDEDEDDEKEAAKKKASRRRRRRAALRRLAAEDEDEDDDDDDDSKKSAAMLRSMLAGDDEDEDEDEGSDKEASYFGAGEVEGEIQFNDVDPMGLGVVASEDAILAEVFGGGATGGLSKKEQLRMARLAGNKDEANSLRPDAQVGPRAQQQRPQPRKANQGVAQLGTVGRIASSTGNSLEDMWDKAPDVSGHFS
jgi:hypothetical protein